MDVPKFDSNIVKWCGYYKTPQEADVVLEQKKMLLSLKNKVIVTSKKELVNAQIKGLDLYKFTIITADK